MERGKSTDGVLIPDWRRVLRRAWSVRLMVLAAFLSGLEVILPFLDGWLSAPAGVFAALSFVTTGGAFAARLLAQSNMEQRDPLETIQ